jgi:hypothetical protein
MKALMRGYRKNTRNVSKKGRMKKYGATACAFGALIFFTIRVFLK